MARSVPGATVRWWGTLVVHVPVLQRSCDPVVLTSSTPRRRIKRARSLERIAFIEKSIGPRQRRLGHVGDSAHRKLAQPVIKGTPRTLDSDRESRSVKDK